MKESQKTNILRGAPFRELYFRGKGIDIGSGPSLVVANAEPFDLADGDANHILKRRQARSYDFVHSSHCLEHMDNAEHALRDWWELLKPGGYMILVVPEASLYEQKIWPSIFNSDHKWSFIMRDAPAVLPKSLNITELVSSLPNSKMISAEIMDHSYDHEMMIDHNKPVKISKVIMSGIYYVAQIPIIGEKFSRVMQRFFLKYMNIPADQTLTGALAQIQVVVLKVNCA